MEITYELPWHQLTKGDVIGFNELPQYGINKPEPLYIILTIDKHGYAEIIPWNQNGGINGTYQPSWSYGNNFSITYDGNNINKYGELQATDGTWWYFWTSPLSESMTYYEGMVQNSPFYNYLIPVQFEPQRAYTTNAFFTPRNYGRDYDFNGDGGGGHLYSTNISCPNSGTFHWRPLVIQDIIKYGGSSSSILKNRFRKLCQYDDLCFADGFFTRYNSGITIHDLSTWGYNTYYGFRTDNAVTPVYKIDLASCPLWHLVRTNSGPYNEAN